MRLATEETIQRHRELCADEFLHGWKFRRAEKIHRDKIHHDDHDLGSNSHGPKSRITITKRGRR